MASTYVSCKITGQLKTRRPGVSGLSYLLDHATLGRISKCSSRQKIIESKQNHRTFRSVISVEQVSIRLKVIFSLKHQLIFNDYLSNAFKQKARQSFSSILLTSPVILSFLIFQNQNAAGNVIQFIKNKPYNM